MSAISFSVYGTAAPAGSKRAFRHRHTGQIIVTDANAKARPWKALVTDAAVQAMKDRQPLEGPLLLELTFWVARPKAHYGSGKNAANLKQSAPARPIVKPDLLKLARGVEDALTGIVYRDDSQIVTEILEKVYTENQPRCEVRLVPIVEWA